MNPINEGIDFSSMEKKWIQKWEQAKLFESTPDSRPKFFATFPYPYMNGYLHLGHFYSLMPVEVVSRFKRMRGFNVLFPLGFHCTGSPIENAAGRIRENEPTQWKIMQQLGLTDEEIKTFADPQKWVEYFPKEAKKDLQAMGFGIDWRRSFITTDLNPYYDKFVQWQFNRLNEKGYVVKGNHPVTWCTKDNAPVPDHSRSEGEGEGPQEFTLLKFKMGNEFVVAATLRPETVFGQTNVWANPELTYYRAQVDQEVWIGSRPFFEKLIHQNHAVQIKEPIMGSELIGKTVKAPLIEKEIMILPASFCKADKGSGIVASVPSDAPDDYIALRDLQKNKEMMQEFGLNEKAVIAIKPVAIIDTPELGDLPAVKVTKDLNIQNQTERDKLETAKHLVYKKGFYEGIMGKATGEYAGLKVPQAKEKIKQALAERNEAVSYYELTGKVVCRCLTESVVKIVSNQWFLNYSNLEWKQKCHQALDQLKLYPEISRNQFNYVIDWLNDWPCTREFGLGTRLPFDHDWVIESLSDSTIYMAYYTIAHEITKIPIDQINDAFFNAVLLGKNDSGVKVNEKVVQQLRHEFDYWYPVDLRNSGKDLIQNHLTFFLFNHAAIWDDPKKWPQGIGVNGWITVNGEKMSKSKGNFITMRDIPHRFGIDAARFAVLSGGEGIDDSNFEENVAIGMKGKIESLMEFSQEWHGKGNDQQRMIDNWLESETNRITQEATQFMENLQPKSALQLAFFEFNRVLKWYLRRTNNQPDQKRFSQAIETQLALLHPIMPFITEEIWEKIGKKGMLSQSSWPSFDTTKINSSFGEFEKLVESVMSDIRQIQEVAKISQPKKIILYTAPQWKWKGLAIAKKACEEKPDFGLVMKELMADEEIRSKGALVQNFAKQATKMAREFEEKNQLDENQVLQENQSFLAQEFNCTVEVQEGENPSNDPAKKAQNAFPKKPAIYLE